MQNEEFRSVAASQIVLRELMIPSYANFGGKIHGGIILSLMDKAAFTCAAKHAGGYCVTVSVDTVNFREPVEVGELVALKASINYVGRTSMVVGIRVESEDLASGEVRHTNTSYFTMVAKDQDGKPRSVPGLLLESTVDIRRYIEALKRIELGKQYEHELDNTRMLMNLEDEFHRMEGHRYQLAPGLI